MRTSNDNLLLWLAFLQLNEQATRDWLTGLYNRRYFEATLIDHVAAATRYGRELSLALFDINCFKQINDTQGHAAGDGVLQAFADLLQSTARAADMVCRYGGDEFAVILPETNHVQAHQFAERIAGRCIDAAQTVPVATPGFTVTAGIATLPCDNLVEEADAHLLARKTESRQPPSPPPEVRD